MPAVQQLFREAMELTPNERLELAHLLVESAEEPDPEWWASVEPEVERRMADLRAGKTRTYTLEEVREHIAERLNAGRA